MGLLNLAEELGNVSKACQMMGLSRDTFYRYKSAVDEGSPREHRQRSRPGEARGSHRRDRQVLVSGILAKILDRKRREIDFARVRESPEALAPRLTAAGVAVVGESGVFCYEDIERLEAAGAHAVLVGEGLRRQPDLIQALRVLRGAR
jgi:hypothetical protein